MTAATNEVLFEGFVPTPRRITGPVAATENIQKGWMVAFDADGNVVVVTTALGLKAPGIAEHPSDNSTGADGDKSQDILYGVFVMRNDVADPVDATDLFNVVYAVDNQTVSATDGTGTQSACGVLIGFNDEDEPLVYFTPLLSGLI